MDHLQQAREFIDKNGLDKEICKEFLLKVKEILDREKLPFFLVFGTLLGAYRDNDFITHDTDIDIAIRYEHGNWLRILISSGIFEPITLLRDCGTLISLGYKNHYIDIYIFSKEETEFRSGGYSLTFENVEKQQTIEFLGKEFKTIGNIEEYFEEKYGADWKDPLPGRHASK